MTRRKRRKRASTRPKPRSPGSTSSSTRAGCGSDTAERARGLYNFRSNRFRARLDDSDDGEIEERSLAYQRLRRELLDAERERGARATERGKISEDVMHRVQRDLDLEDSRLDV